MSAIMAILVAWSIRTALLSGSAREVWRSSLIVLQGTVTRGRLFTSMKRSILSALGFNDTPEAPDIVSIHSIVAAQGEVGGV